MEWGNEREKTKKVGPHIPRDSYWGRTQRSRLRDRETLVSPVERLRLWTSGLRGWEGARGTRAKVGREARKNIGRREDLHGVYIVICKMLFHLFSPTSDRGITLGAGK